MLLLAPEQPGQPTWLKRPFKTIKLKAPAGASFPSQIGSAQAAIEFVKSLDPAVRVKTSSD
jgi:hypothetical protein